LMILVHTPQFHALLPTMCIQLQMGSASSFWLGAAEAP
jgi:hypothetical protein